MKSRAAVVWGLGDEWKIEDVEVGKPRAGEVIVRWRAAGLCHSDVHLVTGDIFPPQSDWESIGFEPPFPMVGGHEGAGVVESVGPGVHQLQVGDHVAASFVPSCGTCRWCLAGRGNICDAGKSTLSGGMITDGVHRHHIGDIPATLFAKVGVFSERTCVAVRSLVKVEKSLPFECVALVSCGVTTGWGSATERAGTAPGDVVVVVGVGGIGMNAIQGARIVGASHIIAVDPVEFKRRSAFEFGATDAFASMEEAAPTVAELTNGSMADKVIMTPSVLYGDMMAMGQHLTSKGGTLVVTAVAPFSQTSAAVNLFDLAMMDKEIKGTIFGSMSPQRDIPRLLKLYQTGQLKLDELITNRYSLDQVSDGYRAMEDGTNIRGVLILE